MTIKSLDIARCLALWLESSRVYAAPTGVNLSRITWQASEQNLCISCAGTQYYTQIDQYYGLQTQKMSFYLK